MHKLGKKLRSFFVSVILAGSLTTFSASPASADWFSDLLDGISGSIDSGIDDVADLGASIFYLGEKIVEIGGEISLILADVEDIDDLFVVFSEQFDLFVEDANSTFGEIGDRLERYGASFVSMGERMASQFTEVGETIAGMAEDIAKVVSDNIEMAETLTENIAHIGQNIIDIDTNEKNIATNSDKIATNSGDIATNSKNITTNSKNIATNSENIATNSSNIETNRVDIVANRVAITSNQGNIAVNADNIASNTLGIAVNAADIAALRDDMSTGFAMASAMEVFLPDPGANIRVNVGMGYYDGYSAVGFTGAGRLDNDTAVYFGVSSSSDFSTVSGKAGISWQW